MNTGEVCLPSYMCAVHRASDVMALYFPHACVYKGRRPIPTAKHHTLYQLPELQDSRPRLHSNALSASQMRHCSPLPDLRASLAFHSEVCFPGFWHTAPHSKLFTSHCQTLRHENWVGKITTARNPHAGLLTRSHRSEFVPAGPREIARPASTNISCEFISSPWISHGSV